MISPNKPSIVRKDMDAVLTCMVSEQIGSGEEAQKLVKTVSRDLGYQGGAAFSDLQRCFEIALELAGAEEGDKIALSPLSPAWYYRVLKEKRLVPHLWDIDADTAEPSRTEGFEAGVKAVFCYHHLGIPQNLDFWREMGIPVIEDITEIVGTLFRDEVEEVPGNYTILNLSEEGHFTAGGGGLLMAVGKKEHAALKKSLEFLGSGSMLSNMAAVLGLSQWSRMDRFQKKRAEILAVYTPNLMKSRHRGFSLEEGRDYLPLKFSVLLRTGGKDVFSYAKKKKVSCENSFAGSVLDLFTEETEHLSGARQLSMRCVSFPLYPALTNGDIEHISKVLASLP
jgi:dTDP-4-amino-4,6-dideoxygalactose transaminase